MVLAAAIPVGLAFGLLSTRRLTRRLKRLAALTLEVADGDFGRRVPVSGHDEVSLLEENFNRMAGQLQASLDANRRLAEANARHEERARIARELHDSISQELFSLSVLAGGLRRTLPAGSARAARGGDHGADRGRHDAGDAVAAARAAPGRARGGRTWPAPSRASAMPTASGSASRSAPSSDWLAPGPPGCRRG